MQPGIDRRTADHPRIPLDLWVRLSDEDYEEAYHADGVDLSSGGLALRSDYLPEVGDRLHCRFDCPPEGEEIAVDGEVVWAHDAGERSGQFGLRFGPLDTEIQSSLRRLVEHLSGSVGATRRRARLHLESVATPIEAEVVEADAEWLTVEQELPFLELGMGVVVEGHSGPPRGKLASVDLRLEQGTPRLVLGVEYEQAREPASLEAPAEHSPIEAADATLRDVEWESSSVDAEEPDTLTEARELEAHAQSETDAPEAHGPPHDAAVDAAMVSVERGASVTAATERGTPSWGSLKIKAVELSAKVRPALVVLWAKVVTLLGVVREEVGPKARLASAKARSFATRLSKVLARSLGKRTRRRTTAPPKRVARAPQRRPQHAPAAPAPRKTRRRVLLLSVLAFVGVGAAVYALTGSEEPNAAPVPAVVAAPPPPAPTGAVAEPSEEPALERVDPEEGDVAPAPEPAPVPGGRLEEPTYPSLRDAREEREAPVTEGLTFGSDEVDNGRTATIRMSQPVTVLRGQRQEDGFTVTVPGALALDRAGPIAAANPAVERAMILNRGDHSVLTVRFVAGRNPDYRVAARDRAMEITIAR